MKLNKGEWSELFVGLLSLDRGELKLYKSPLEIKIKDISYDGEYFFNKQHIKNLDIKEFENSLNKGSGVFSLSPEIVKAIGFKKGVVLNKHDYAVLNKIIWFYISNSKVLTPKDREFMRKIITVKTKLEQLRKQK